MKLVDNWRAVLARAWSIRLILLAGLFSGLEAALPFIGQLPFNPWWLSVITTLVVAGAFVARLVAQPSINPET